MEENVYYNENGKEQVDEKGAYARKSSKSFYLKDYYGQLFKKDVIVRSVDQNRLQWKKVGPECFKTYLTYLKTNKETSYLVANRNTQD